MTLTNARAPRGSEPTPSPAWRALLLLGLAAVAYANADHQLFLFDSKHIEQVDGIGAGDALEEFRAGRLNPDAPLTFVTFAWNAAFNRAVGLESFDPTTFLAVNVLLHAMNALLLLLLVGELLQLIGAEKRLLTWMPLALAALFVVHPLQASSVAYIIQRRGLLAATFYLLGVLCYLRARGRRQSAEVVAGRSSTGWSWRRLLWLAAIPLCYWLSFRAKNLGLTLPLTLVVIELAFRTREGVPLKRTLLPLIGVLLLSGGGILMFLSRKGLIDPASFSVGHFGPQPGWGPWEHLLTEARVFAHYWKLLLFPLPGWSSIDQEIALSRSLLDHGAGAAILLHLALIALAVVAARRRRTLLAIGIGWFYVALIPYAILPQRELFAEYKTYLPGVGLFLLLAGALLELDRRLSVRTRIVGMAILVGLCLAATLSRNVIYQSRVNLWTDAVRKAPGKWRPHYNLGSALIEDGRFEEAEAHLAEATRLDPELHLAHSNLAGLLARQGRDDEALAHYDEAVRLRPNWSKGHYRLANALARAGRIEDSITHYSVAIELDPDLAEAHANLAVALSRAGRLDEAVERFSTASRLRPDSDELRRHLQRSRQRAAAAQSAGELATAPPP